MVTGEPAFFADLLDRLEQLGTQLDGVAERLAQVDIAATRTRRLAWGLAGSFVLDVALTIVVTVLTIGAVTQGSSLHASQLAACSISNQTRENERTLWGYLVSVSEQSPKANKDELVKFQQFVNKTFAPLNCTQIYH
jgi:hypothetical protein